METRVFSSTRPSHAAAVSTRKNKKSPMRWILLLAVMLLPVSAIFAGTGPTTANQSCANQPQYGTYNSSNHSNMYGPINSYWKYNYRQTIYLASELGYNAGTITAIAYNYQYTSAMTTKGSNVTIYMANTTKSEFESTSDWVRSGWTQVYTGSVKYTATGWGWLVLDTPFQYTGGNLIVALDDGYGSCESSSNYHFYHDGVTTTPYRQLYQTSDSQNLTQADVVGGSTTTGTQGTYRPLTKFCINGGCETRPGDFSFDIPTVSVTAGQSYTQTVSGGSNVTYSISCTPTGIASINTSTGRVTTVTGSEGTATVTATWPGDATYCDKTATYTINIGDGCAQMTSGTISSSGTYGGIYTYFNYYAYTQQLYLANEIRDAGGCQGTINSISFHYGGTSSTDLSFEVYIGTTSATTVPTTWITDANLRLVYSGTRTFTTDNNGWNKIIFSTPFEWDGASNIVIAIRRTSSTQGNVQYPNFYHTNSDGMAAYLSNSSSSITLNGSYVASSSGSTTSQRPQLRWCIDCCNDNITGDFSWDNPSIDYVLGSGAPMTNTLNNGTGQNTGISYSTSHNSVSINNNGVITNIPTSVGECDITVTAKLTNGTGGCDRYATYVIHVTDGCAKIGTGTTNYYTTPIYNSGTSGYYSYSQQLYNAAEILAAGGCQGQINDIKFQYATSSSFSQSIQVYMGTTSQTTLADAWISDADLQLVYTGTPTFTQGWTTLHLNTPYDWNGVDNIVVAVKTIGASESTARYFCYTSTTGGARNTTSSTAQIALNGSNVPTVTGSSSSYRPNIKFCIDCCVDNLSGDFAWDYPAINYVLGSGAPMVNTLNNGTGQNTGISYSTSNDAVSIDNNGVITNIPTSVGECDITVTAKLTNAATDGCNRYASYTIHVTDGCATAGDGTSTTSYAPVYNSGTSGYYSYSQMIYGAEEILNDGGCKGEIRTIKFKSSTSENFNQSVQIYMGTTLTNNLNNGWLTGIDGLQLVYSGPVTFLASNWTSITLQNSFYWNGMDNIVVAVKSTSASGSTSRYFYYTSFTTNTMRYTTSSSAQIALNGSNVPSSASGTTSTARPNMKFCIDCCDEIAEGAFNYDQPEVEYVIGSGTFTPPHLTNETGMTGITYTSVSDAENGESVGSVNTNTGVVSFTGNEGYITVTARLSVAGGCPRFARYRVFVNDGCKRIGTGTNTTNSYSLTNNYKYILSEMIYKGSEINAGGTINRISIRIAQVASSANPRTTKIYMALTDKTTFSSSTDFINPADMTEVWSGTLTNTSTGWFDFNLSRSFSVPCGKNLVIAFDMDGNTYTSDYFYYTSIPSSGIRAYSDSNNPPTSGVAAWVSGNTSNYSELFAARPNIKLCITECNCPELYFHVPNVTFCTNATPQHPEFTCQSSGTRNWTSSDDNVVRITNSTTGAMTVRGAGNAIITLNVAATGQYCAAAASYNVRVIQNCPTLHYDLSGCTGTSTPASIPDYTGYGVTTLYDGVPTCSTPGMAFAGWCVSSDGDGAYYQPGAQFPLYRDTTLYAIFYTKCCHPDSSTVTYTHQTVTFDGSGYTVNPNQSVEVTRSDDGFFYYDLCLGEGDGKIHATVNLPDGCSYTNQSWRLEYADGTQLISNNTGNSFEYVIDSVIGYGLTFRARAATGCWVNLNGRIRVSPGIGVTAAPIETFSVCPENYTPITIGLPEEENVQVQVNRPGTTLVSTLGHAERIFLPDGVPCDLDGDGSSDCGYVSAVNFTDFQPGGVIRSVEDILYLSMSIEHSFIGDLFIKVTCPNGQEATILKKYTSGSSDCLNSILALSSNESDVRGWQVSGSGGADFGVPNTSYASSSSGYACDSSYSSNAIGTPWTYAWSNNSVRGYEYAGGTYGLVYETENVHNSSVDSTNLGSMTNLYHPDQSFESLVGCPLNGEWKITVIDGYSVDNGWLVDWQLALSEDLAGEVWNYQVDLDTAFMSCTLNNHSKSVTIHSPEISEAGDYDCHLVLIDEYGCVRDNDLNYHFNIKDITVGVDVQGAECGVEDGYIHASVTNGGCGPTALYTYTLVSSASGATTTNNSGRFNNLGGGDYTLTVECEEGCSKNMNINIPNTGSVALTLNSAVAETCVGANNGSISVSAGSGNFTYTATDGTHNYSSTTGSFTGVAPGTYTVTVTDNGTGCQGTLENVTVAAATPLTLTLTTPTTGGCPIAAGSNYTITANPSGGTGTGTYTSYNWTTSTGTIVVNGNTATIQSDGHCHEYFVTLSLQDGNGCPVSNNASFSTVDNTPPVIATTATNNQDWGCDPTNIVAPTFTATDNCPTAGTALTPTVTDGGVQNGANCTKSRTWTANVTDNCNNPATQKSITYTWTESQAPTASALPDTAATMGSANCQYMIPNLSAYKRFFTDPCGGEITFVSQSVAANTPYTQNSSVQNITVNVVVQGTCEKKDTMPVNVTIPAKDITVDIDQTGASVCSGGDTVLTATASSSNGTPDLTWSVTGGATITPTAGSSVTATATGSATVTVTATDPAGCTATDQIAISINPEVTLSIDNNGQTQCLGAALSPNIVINYTNATLNDAEIAAACTARGLTYNNGTISGIANTPGDITIHVVATSDQNPQCSQQEDDIVIHITNVITPVIEGPADVCVNTSEANTQISLSETAGNNTFTYNWNVGDGGTILSGQGTNAITAQWSSTHDKTVTVTLTLDECQAQATKTIHVHDVPVATITPVTDVVCPNAGTIAITGTNVATSADYTYTWGGDFALNHTTNTVSTPTDAVTATVPSSNCNTTYTVTLNVIDSAGCKNTATPITVTVKDDEAPQITGTMPDKDIFGCGVNDLPAAATTVAQLEAAATADGGSLAISDNCTNDKSQLRLRMARQTTSGNCPMVVTRRYLVKDLCDNESDTIFHTIRINLADNITISETDRTVQVDCPSLAVALPVSQLPVVTDACNTELEPTLDVSPNPAIGHSASDVTCNGDSTYTYYYKDCAGHEATWTLTYEIRHPDLRELDSIKYNVACEADAVDYQPDTIHDACGNVLAAVENLAAFERNIVAGEGYVSYTWQYTDCEGTVRDRVIYYTVHPDASFEPTPGATYTVSCPRLAVPIVPPARTVCAVNIDYGTAEIREGTGTYDAGSNPGTVVTEATLGTGLPEDSCGWRRYTYTYYNPSDVVIGHEYELVYHYNINSANNALTVSDVSAADTVECYDADFQPTLPIVTNTCGIVIDPESTDLALVRDLSQYTGNCQGKVTYTYHYVDCGGNDYDFVFTRRIIRTTVPHLTSRPDANEANVQCLSAATPPTSLPTVVDVCNTILSDPQPTPVITDDYNDNTCSGTRVYSYTYTDCAGLDTTWTFTYHIQHTSNPAEKPNGEDGYVTALYETDVICPSYADGSFTMPVILDACGTELTPTASSPVISEVNCQGNKTYTYRYEDCAGLYTTWTFTYNITRTEDPHVEVAGSQPLDVDCYTDAVADNIPTLPVVKDQCGTVLNPTNADNPTVNADGSDTYDGCSGTVSYTYNYEDCANRQFAWQFVFTVTMPESQPLADADSSVYCESYAVEDAIPFPTHQFSCGTSHTISAADRTNRVSTVTNGTGEVTYTYSYSDCKGTPYTWNFVYHVRAQDVDYPADEYATVYCATSVTAPTTPVLPICDVPDVFDGVTPVYEGTLNDGCGDTTFVYRYTINGVDTAWRYHYHVQPGDFTLPEDVVINVECYNDEQPAAALVPVVAANDSICEAINPSAPVRNADGFDTYDGCRGTVSYTYTYSNCNHTHTWKYTYNVQRITVPQVSEVSTGSYVTCADQADGNFTMPTVTDACGAEITAPTPVIEPANPTNCNSTQTYTYTYVDPCNANLTSQFVYTYTINDTVRPTINPIPANEIPAAIPAGDCQYQIPSLETVVMTYAEETCSSPIWVGQTPAAGTIRQAQATATTESVVVTIKDGCDNVRTTIVNVTIPANSLQLPTIAGVSICEGQQATLTAAPTSDATPVNCVWTTGNTTVGQGESPLPINVSPTENTTYTVTAVDAAGCSAERNVVVSVNHPTSTSFTQVVCEGYDWYNHGTTTHYSEPGTYTNDYLTAQNCPSTDTLYLTVYYNTSTEFTETACESYTWTNHNWSQVFTTSGTYQHEYQTEQGCWSTDVLHLTINYNTNTTFNETACNSYIWNNHGWSNQYTVSGTYTHDYTTDQGCPSTDVLHLTVNYSGTGDVWVTECEAYNWFGYNYTTSGDYSHDLRTTHNCDSTVTLHLTIIGTYETNLYDTVCFGESYTWFNDTYTTSGDYTHMLTSMLGCDSMLTMHLYQLPVVRVDIEEQHDCRTGEYTLTLNSVNADQYEWWAEPDNGELTPPSHETEVTVMPLVRTTYYAKAWRSDFEECAVTTNIEVEPVRMPRASFDLHPGYLSMERTEWNATDHSTDIDWRTWYVNGSYYGDESHINGTINPPIDSLTVVLIAGTDECQDTARRVIPFANVNLWVPNAFTPSQDWNNLFGAEGTGIKDFEMWVFTREGMLVFHSESMADKWDGKHKGTKCPQSSYTYRIKYTTVVEPESEMVIVGTVTLLR